MQGIYVVMLSNKESQPIYNGAITHVNYMNVKYGKAENLENRRNNYLGEDFSVEKFISYSIPEHILTLAEIEQLLHPLFITYRHGASREWLANISSEDVQAKIEAIFLENNIESQKLVENFCQDEISGENAMEIVNIPDNIDHVALTLESLNYLEAEGFTDELFRELHHLNTSLSGHREYCEAPNRTFRRGNNMLLSNRLEYIVNKHEQGERDFEKLCLESEQNIL
ncbi:hypothetical protein ACXR6G_18840 [Ancylomarina sp. YFZ004]